MAFLEWSDTLSVHYEPIDADHKKLCDLINLLNELAENGGTPPVVDTALKQMIVFTKTHFSREETLMRKTAYPQIIPHKIEHDRLLKQMDDFEANYASGKFGLSQDTIIFLRTWLCEHVLETDMPLGRWMAKFDHPPQETTS
jgi:hemerythrin